MLYIYTYIYNFLIKNNLFLRCCFASRGHVLGVPERGVSETPNCWNEGSKFRAPKGPKNLWTPEQGSAPRGPPLALPRESFLACPECPRIHKKKSILRGNVEKIKLSIRMTFSIENGFFILGPSLPAEKQGLGLKFSIENEIFKPRMKISSENENVVRGGMVFSCVRVAILFAWYRPHFGPPARNWKNIGKISARYPPISRNTLSR